MALPHLHLISFPLCPFVQRSVILLKHKNVPFELTLLNPQELPDWFLERSPTGKVPLLLVDQDTAVFESAVISEYVDEITPPPMLPTAPLERALERAWIAFVSDLVMAMHRWMTAPTEEAFRTAGDEAAKGLQRLEAQCKAAPCFSGPDLSLLDAALAPVLMRLDAGKENRTIQSDVLPEGFGRTRDRDNGPQTQPREQRNTDEPRSKCREGRKQDR
ncbi:MAG: glutathione S-transferase family protein [Candidatus Brocadiia bacterium]